MTDLKCGENGVLILTAVTGLFSVLPQPSKTLSQNMFVAQKVYQLWGWWLDSRLLLSYVEMLLGKTLNP